MFYLVLVLFLTKLYRLSVIGYRLSVIGYRLDIKAVQIRASPR
ncbi:hypothetical protein NB618_08675 [Vibrio antiquarius]|nr:hypothetical protein [Vibrio antiquarius]MCR9936517.1 hypothetical protein [Vibrio antiquarius]